MYDYSVVKAKSILMAAALRYYGKYDHLILIIDFTKLNLFKEFPISNKYYIKQMEIVYDCQHDSLRIYDGTSADAETLVAELCSRAREYITT